MKRSVLVSLALAAAATVGLAAGCEREVEHRQTTTANPRTGEVKTSETTVKQTPSGTVVEEKRTTEPGVDH